MPPATPTQRGIYQAQVSANRLICLDHYLLRLDVASFPPTTPGQFVNVLCRASGQNAEAADSLQRGGSPFLQRGGSPFLQRGGSPEPPRPGDPSGANAAGQETRRAKGTTRRAGQGEWDWRLGWPRLNQPELAGRQPLLRRPFGLAGRRELPGGGAALELIHRVVGVGTAALAELEEGAVVNIMGPLGNGFRVLVDRPAAALVGGGVGIPPLLYLAEHLRQCGKEVVAFAGARSAGVLPLTIDVTEPPSQSGWPAMCTAEFAARGASTVVATDDGSLGVTGFVHEPFARWLEDRRQGPSGLAVYACGPEPMMQAVGEICLKAGIPCQLALERHMACGIGTCQGCVRKVKADAPPGWRYKLVCADGPVFEAAELAW